MVDWDKITTQTNQYRIAFTIPHTQREYGVQVLLTGGKNITTVKPIQDSFHYTTHTQRE